MFNSRTLHLSRISKDVQYSTVQCRSVAIDTCINVNHERAVEWYI